MLNVFKEHKVKELKTVTIPEPLFTESGKNASDDQILRILKYVYSNQNIYSIKDMITETNVFAIYAQAYVLKMKKLMADLAEIICSNILTQDNCTVFYYDSIKFHDEKIQKACENLMVKKFAEIVETNDKPFLNLPLKNFISVCKNSSLNVQHEY